jgi:hypothetical protein
VRNLNPPSHTFRNNIHFNSHSVKKTFNIKSSPREKYTRYVKLAKLVLRASPAVLSVCDPAQYNWRKKVKMCPFSLGKWF